MTWSADLTRELTSATYEITVVGARGPVLRAAMQPLVATASGPCTTLRTALSRRGDLADLLAALDARGLEVTHVAVRPAAHPHCAPAPAAHPHRAPAAHPHCTPAPAEPAAHPPLTPSG
jgi:hypothetical protein